MLFSFRRPSPRVVGVASALITVLMWTAFIVVARAGAHRTLTPFDITFMRFVGAGLVLVPVGWWMVRRARGQGPSWLGLSPLPARLTITIGLLAGVAYSCLAYSGFYFAPATHASVLMPGTLPLFTALVAAVVLRDRITPVRAIGLGLILGGDLLVGGASLLQAFDGGTVWIGDLLFMTAAFCWANYTVIARRNGLAAVQATVAVSVFALLAFVPLYALLATTGVIVSHLLQAPWQELLFQGVFQGVGSVVISGITFTQMVRYFGPVRSTMITALVPGLSALGAVWLLNEPVHWNLLVGLLSVTAGIVFGVRATAAVPPAAARA